MDIENRFFVKIQCLHQMSGSCFLLSVNYPDKRIERFTIDCGRFNKSESYLNEFFPFDPKECLFSINTHVHDDHVSRYPLFVKQGFTGTIYSTITSSKFVSFILYNNSRMMLKRLNCLYSEPLYNDTDVENTLKHWEGYPFGRIIKPTKNISFILYPNGHIPGACMIYIVISYPGKNDIVLFFTGDYNDKNMFFNVPELPNSVLQKNISLVVSEATYGTTDSFDKSQKPKMIDDFKYFLENNKKIIIPAFALGRVQECIALIGNAQMHNILPNVPINVDGTTARFFTNSFIYDDLGLSFNKKILMTSNLNFIKSISERNQILDTKNPGITIAPGGCSDYGSIVPHMINGIPRDDVVIYYPGYTSPNSTGGLLKLSSKGDIISYQGHNLVINCDVDFTSELSAHAKRDVLLKKILKPLNANSYLLNHGETNVIDEYKNYLSFYIQDSTIDMINANKSFIVGSSGIISVINESLYDTH